MILVILVWSTLSTSQSRYIVHLWYTQVKALVQRERKKERSFAWYCTCVPVVYMKNPTERGPSHVTRATYHTYQSDGDQPTSSSATSHQRGYDDDNMTVLRPTTTRASSIAPFSHFSRACLLSLCPHTVYSLYFLPLSRSRNEFPRIKNVMRALRFCCGEKTYFVQQKNGNT